MFMTTDMYAVGPPGRTEAIVPLVRKTFGDEMALYADSNSFYSVEEAIRVGKLLQEYKYEYFEEPVMFDHIEEIKQSLHIIDQVLHRMPDGPVMTKLPRLLRVPPGRAFIAIESPRGQYAAYAISDGSDQPFRLRIHDPSYFNLQSVGLLTPGHLVADIMAIMASLDPIMGGVDK